MWTTRITISDYVWRGHKHNIDDSGDRLEGTRVICIPSWQLKTEFGHRVVPNRTRSDIGGYIVDGGLVDNSRSRYKGQPDQRRNNKIMTENELLDELAKELIVPEIDKNEITANMLSIKTGISTRQALSILRKKEQDGLLKSRWVRGQYRKMLAFSKI